MLAYGFTRSQVCKLSKLNRTQLLQLETWGAIAPVAFNPVRHEWQSVILCTVYSSLNRLCSKGDSLNMIRQLKRAIGFKKVSVWDMFHFQSWNNFQVGYQQLDETTDWERDRWVIRFLSAHDCSQEDALKVCQRLCSVRITASGEIVVTKSSEDVLICVYIRGIFEQLLHASTCTPKLFKTIGMYIDAAVLK